MAGGIGSRFWPQSRSGKPKQFFDMLGIGNTLIQQTWNRVQRFCPTKNIFVVTNQAYEELVKKQLPKIKDEQILLEPNRRNTAPCIAYAAYKIKELNPDANIVVAPSDHLIIKEDKFISVIKEALSFTEKNDCLVTLGISPTRPDTGYGYIQFNETDVEGFKGVNKVKTFTEKPNLTLAKQFIESGDFVWNSGMFIWSVKSILKAFEQHMPETANLFKEGGNKYNTPEEENFVLQTYALCKSNSIDYGVMEKSDNVYVIRADIGWSDLGTWGSLYEHLHKDKNKNALLGKHFEMDDSKNCIVSIPKDKLAVIQGLDDYIVVDTENVLLICPKKDEQQIKHYVNNLKLNKGDKFV